MGNRCRGFSTASRLAILLLATAGLLIALPSYAQAMKPVSGSLEQYLAFVVKVRGTSGTTTTVRTITAPTRYVSNLGAAIYTVEIPSPFKTSSMSVTALQVEMRAQFGGVDLNLSRLICGAATCNLPAFAPVTVPGTRALCFAYDRVKAAWSRPPEACPTSTIPMVGPSADPSSQGGT